MRIYSDEELDAWARKKRQEHRLKQLTKKHPFLTVGLPFLIAVVGGSLVLLPSQETKYEVRDRRIKAASLQEQMGQKPKRSLQEEYFRMKSNGAWKAEWEPKRVERPPEEEPVFDRQGPN
ncbi:Cytochrome oxidase assembly [Coemansia sp. Benny D115]|nr:Cytochrome oxidase assembly [Coemansia sp. Benny D115]